MATDPALIGWQRLGGFTFRRKIDHTSLHIYSASESRPPSYKFAHQDIYTGESASLREERPRGANLVIKYGTSARDHTR